ncbi:hypothetical protein B9Z55_019625 [Caenorhabditis nigoni]|uniref:C-type lectin domain-containing protein n=1 Tax=Caenorhabditis nigoni TaxID=1611254 RepID=A0A2G5TJC2_9PELO|nr:hypothetical protein B9Z55_019625 [Caenorhabditis nigoni]
MTHLITFALVLISSVSLLKASCPEGFDVVNSKCITITSKRFTHHKALLECSGINAHLVFIQNAIVGYPVTNVGTCVYIDSDNQPLKGRWISATCELDEYHAICESN